MRLRRDERGLGLITVIGVAGILAVLGTAIAVRSVGGLRQAGIQRRSEVALHIADGGVEHTLYKLTKNRSYSNAAAAPSFASDEAERQWVLDQAASLPVVTAEDGEWAVVKPASTPLIYSVGYVPSRATPDRIRVIRAAYDFPSFIPAAAILADGAMSFSGNPQVGGALGDVHTNGNLSMNGGPTFSGNASSSGSWTTTGGSPTSCSPAGEVTDCDTADSTGSRPTRTVPEIHPRDYYWYSEYDLCPDGKVRAGPSYTAGGANPNLSNSPCTGDVLANANSSSYRGWTKTGNDASKGALWAYSASTPYDGVYYVYQGSASISGSAGTPTNPLKLTLLAEASPESGTEPHCPHIGGDIKISGNPTFRYHDKAHPLILVAGRDLEFSGDPESGQLNYEGVLLVHEQFSLSGSPTIHGAIIADDACDSPASPVHQNILNGNPTVIYNGDIEVPAGTRIRVTHWLEL